MSRLCALRWMPARAWISRDTRWKSRSSKSKSRTPTSSTWRARETAAASLTARSRRLRRIAGDAGLEPVAEGIGRKRWRVQEALRAMATQAAQQVGLGVVLHALGGHLQ